MECLRGGLVEVGGVAGYGGVGGKLLGNAAEAELSVGVLVKVGEGEVPLLGCFAAEGLGQFFVCKAEAGVFGVRGGVAVGN